MLRRAPRALSFLRASGSVRHDPGQDTLTDPSLVTPETRSPDLTNLTRLTCDEPPRLARRESHTQLARATEARPAVG
eukprot:gene20631-27426_t